MIDSDAPSIPPLIETPHLSLIELLEALLITSPTPLSAQAIELLLKETAKNYPEEKEAQQLATFSLQSIEEELEKLAILFQERGRCLALRKRASGWQLISTPRVAPWLRELFPEARPPRLSRASLETLAIIAYRQPVTKADIEAIRGVSTDSMVQKLLERSLIHIVGREESPGRPLLYGTTQAFLDHFGLLSLEELPNSSELRQISIPSNNTEQQASV